MEISQQKDLWDLEKRLQVHRSVIRRADAVLALIAIMLTVGVVFLPGADKNTNFVIAVPTIAFAVGGSLAIYFFPWHRYHPDLFVVIGIAAIAQISLLIWATGGPNSPLYPLYFFVVVAAGAYHSSTWSLWLIISLAAVGAASFPLYARPVAPETIWFLSVLIVVFVTVGIITSIFFRSLTTTARELEKRVRELMALNNMFQEYLRQDHTSGREQEQVRTCLEQMKAQIAKLEQLLRPSSS